MASPLRPVVALISLASLLFLLDGWLDGAYPGGPAWVGGLYAGAAVLSYLFALVNAAVAILIARGSERTLQLRIGLAAFFLVERPLTAFALGAKPEASVALHLATAAVELVILVLSVSVWRLGRSVADAEVAALLSVEERVEAPRAGDRRRGMALPPRTAWTIGVLAVLLAGLFVADGVSAGFVPGGREWGISSEASGWLAYVFAAATLAVTARALADDGVGLRILFAVALLFCLERAFSPLALRSVEPIGLALHLVAAFLALALGLAAAGAIRASGARAPASLSPAQTSRA